MAEARPLGPGVLRVVTGTDPAANTEISETVPAGKMWRIISINFTLVTDGTAANRRPRLFFDDGTTEFYRVGSTQDHAASTTYVYTAAAQGASQSNNGNTVMLPLPPDLILGPGFRIRTSTASAQSTDNYGAPAIYVEEWDT